MVPVALAPVLLVQIVRAWPTSQVASGADPDATVLISTFILIYTFFIAAYGALTPAMTGARSTGAGHVLALVLMLLAVEIDLYRVVNSAGDLYATTVRSLPPNKIHDAAAEFGGWFLMNVLVILVTLVVLSWDAANRRFAPDGPPAEVANPHG